jgi:hypothetical protein
MGLSTFWRSSVATGFFPITDRMCPRIMVVNGDEHALSDIASVAAAAAATAVVVTWMCRRHPLASFSTIILISFQITGLVVAARHRRIRRRHSAFFTPGESDNAR